MAVTKVECFNCQLVTESASPIGRRDECSKCGADLHCCRNCQHYDRTAYNECKESAAEVIREKDRANFCDHYTPRAPGGVAVRDKAADLRAAAEALFKKK